ncbi:hypothetical protein [Agathobacter ruminis]|uniref:hypothetical protein n=1 Tax=Agathobacter ruminis TaxID=1712665 RepID=UPI001A9A5331|nr:hypothetical protein [Agathobacter ruminis]
MHTKCLGFMDFVCIWCLKLHTNQQLFDGFVCFAAAGMHTKCLGFVDGLRMHLMPEIGDPYEEFYKLESFGVEVSIPYCIGQIDAYFEDAVPIDFGTTDAVCVAHDPSWYHSRKISDASSS